MAGISKITIFFALFIIVSASFMRQLSDFLKVNIGTTGFVISIGLILIGAGLAFFIFTVKHNPGWLRLIGVLGLLTAGLILVWQISIPIERIHLLEYGILGLLTTRDLGRKAKTARGIILAGIFVTIIGCFDESFQAILPYRVFDLRDIGFNSLGGVWGIALYLLSHSL